VAQTTSRVITAVKIDPITPDDRLCERRLARVGVAPNLVSDAKAAEYIAKIKANTSVSRDA